MEIVQKSQIESLVENEINDESSIGGTEETNYESSLTEHNSIISGVIIQESDQNSSNSRLLNIIQFNDPISEGLIASNDLIARINPREITPIKWTIENQCTLEVDSTLFIIKKENFSKWNIGIIGAYANTWVSDADTRLGFKENSLIFNDIVFTPVLGAYAEFRINKKFGLSSEIFFNSIIRSRINLFEEGNLIKKETELEYFNTSLLATKYFPLKKSSINLSAGVYLSFLKRSLIKSDGVITTINSNYTPLDYGFKLDLSQQVRLKSFTLSYGLNANYGIANIFSGTSHLPSDLNETHNVVIGANIKLGYQL